MSTPPNNLAADALENLVNQFARPLDCLRELVQNAIDAGTPRVEVRVRFAPSEQDPELGVLSLHVDDFGEGMNERIIDGQLTRMFSSAKEGDLTKIGKFGIGFTSIFAIRPSAVLLRTGRNEESWEVLFHADRSFEKRRVDEPLSGTKITLFKRMSRAATEPFVNEARDVLCYWVEHAELPITWHDERDGTEESTPELLSSDPFAAFAAPEEPSGSGEAISRPLDLPGAIAQVHHKAQDREILLGYCESATHGFYSGGLTLISNAAPEALESWSVPLGHLSFKVRDSRVEHTLTRDNVLKDEHWTAALTAVQDLLPKARAALVEATHAAIQQGEPVAHLHRMLAFELRDPDAAEQLYANPSHTLFRDVGGQPLTLKQIGDQVDQLGFVLLEGDSRAVHEALADAKLHVVSGGRATADLLQNSEAPGFFGRSKREVVLADSVYVAPQRVHLHDLPPMERDLFKRAARMVAFATEQRVSLEVGNFGGPDDSTDGPLCLEGPSELPLFRRGDQVSWWPSQLRHRTVLVHRHHRLLTPLRVLSVSSPVAAAYALAQLILHTDEHEGDASWPLLDLALKAQLRETA